MFLLLCSCNSGRYVEVYAFKDDIWLSAQAAVFEYRISDTITPATIDISFRYNSDMKLWVLPLEIKSHQDRSFEYWVDTIYMTLREHKQSRPLGTHYTNHTELTVPYRTGIQYLHRGIRTISIRQLSDSTALAGAMSLGVVATSAEQQ